MKVKLTGLSSNIELLFVDHVSYNRLFGYTNTFCNYNHTVSETLVFTMWSPSGFNDSLPIEIFKDKGVGEKGSAYRGTSYGDKVIAWNFKPSFIAHQNVSPHKILNALVNSGEIVEVKVNDIYTGHYVFENNTTSEGGLITMVNADVNNGVFWSKGIVIDEFFVFERAPYIPKTLPQVLLNDITYPLKIEITSETEVNPVVTIGGEINGIWNSFDLKINEEQTLSYDNSINGDKYIIFDSENLTITNENGIDRLDEIISTNGDKFPILIPVINNWELIVNDKTELIEIQDIPTDMRVEVKREELSSTIEGFYE